MDTCVQTRDEKLTHLLMGIKVLMHMHKRCSAWAAYLSACSTGLCCGSFGKLGLIQSVAFEVQQPSIVQPA